jgi:DNA invertase Pin-like site-specific DNA recombinase
MSTTNATAGLRFAALIRVSTEKQEREGESLNTQRADCVRDVERLGGTITEWYGGQEHATPGWEKKELKRLIADAGKGRWGAVIVNNADRWSRDNTQSKEGLDAFRKHGLRFFVGSSEFDLFCPTHNLFLGMSAEIGQFVAANQFKKSVENRIARAKRACPWPATCRSEGPGTRLPNSGASTRPSKRSWRTPPAATSPGGPSPCWPKSMA